MLDIASIADARTRASAAHQVALALAAICPPERDALLYLALDKYGADRGWRDHARRTTGISTGLWHRILSRRGKTNNARARQRLVTVRSRYVDPVSRHLPELAQMVVPDTEPALLARIRTLHQGIAELYPQAIELRNAALLELFPHYSGNAALGRELGIDGHTLSRVRVAAGYGGERFGQVARVRT